MTNVLIHVPSRAANIQILETQDAAEGDADAFFSKPLNKNIKKLPEKAMWSKELKKYNPFVNVIFCTGYSEYMQDAIGLHASGYLLKPAETESVKKALDNLLHPIEQAKPHFFARTFGTFDFLVNGEPLHFKRSKAKEMLAYLVSLRGASANRKDIIAALFGDKYDDQTQNYLSKIYKDLMETLKDVGGEKIVRKSFNTYSVNTDLFSCDLYDYDKGDPNAINAYHGEYMAQYEWGEM